MPLHATTSALLCTGSNQDPSTSNIQMSPDARCHPGCSEVRFCSDQPFGKDALRGSFKYGGLTTETVGLVHGTTLAMTGAAVKSLVV